MNQIVCVCVSAAKVNCCRILQHFHRCLYFLPPPPLGSVAAAAAVPATVAAAAIVVQ